MSHAVADIALLRPAALAPHRAAAELDGIVQRLLAVQCEIRAMRELPAAAQAWLVLHLSIVAQRVQAAADALDAARAAPPPQAADLPLEPFRLVASR